MGQIWIKVPSDEYEWGYSETDTDGVTMKRIIVELHGDEYG